MKLLSSEIRFPTHGFLIDVNVISVTQGETNANKSGEDASETMTHWRAWKEISGISDTLEAVHPWMC